MATKHIPVMLLSFLVLAAQCLADENKPFPKHNPFDKPPEGGKPFPVHKPPFQHGKPPKDLKPEHNKPPMSHELPPMGEKEPPKHNPMPHDMPPKGFKPPMKQEPHYEHKSMPHDKPPKGLKPPLPPNYGKNPPTKEATGRKLLAEEEEHKHPGRFDRPPMGEKPPLENKPFPHGPHPGHPLLKVNDAKKPPMNKRPHPGKKPSMLPHKPPHKSPTTN